MKFVPILTIAILLIVTSLSFAAQFDIWQTGMTLSDVVDMSRQNNIPIRQSGVINSSKGFNEALVNERFWKASKVGYVANLLGVNSTVELQIIPEWPSRVYEIQVKFSGTGAASQQFKGELLDMLKKKYGSPQMITLYLHKAYRWNLGENDEVILSMLSFPTLYYSDVQMKKYVEKIRGYKEQNLRNGYTRKDSGKF